MIISDRLWEQRFARAPGAVGRIIHLDDVPYTVIGVMPPRFGFPVQSALWIAFAPAEGVCLEGVEWPLRDETLLPGSRGVSNRLVATEARLTVRSGWLLLCHLFER